MLRPAGEVREIPWQQDRRRLRPCGLLFGDQRLVEAGHRRGRGQAELVRQRLPELVVDRQCLRHPADVAQRGHLQRAEAFAQRMPLGDIRDPLDHGRRPAGGDLRLGPVLEDVEELPLQPSRGGVDQRYVS